MVMTLFVAALLAQDPVQRQLDEALRRFEQAVRAQEAYEALSDQLAALGEAALVPIARRLAEDLRDGMASATAPALLMALAGHPESLAPLREAFDAPETVTSGRLEIATALARLEDHRSWRDGLRAIAADSGAEPDDRIRASQLLLLDDELGGPPPAREAGPGLEEPRASLVDEVDRPASPARRSPDGDGARKKDGTSKGSFITMRSVVAGAAAGLVALLLALKRKG